MGATAADLLVETIIDWGVDLVFGLPGDGINGIMEALRTRQQRIRFIQVRHEEAAAFMACAYAKWTGRLGCCLATSGPGGIHLLNGLYDAKLDGAPVLAITGLQYHDLIGTYTQQDVELDRLFTDVAKYNERIMGPAHVENVVSLACRTALAYRGVAHVTIAVDVQSLPAGKDEPSPRNRPHHVSDRMAEGGHWPDAIALERAAQLLNDGRKVAILAGRGALGASDKLLQAADLLAAPIAKALLGKGAVPDDHPLTTGGVGLLGTKPSQEALERCDTLLIVGSSFPYIEFYPKPGQARCVQIELDPQRIGLRYPAEIGLVGDARRCLGALLPLLHRKEDRSFLESAQTAMRQWRDYLEQSGSSAERPMKPQRVMHELARLLADDAVIATDSGTVTGWVARHVPLRGAQLFGVSGNLASMGCALPYAIAAQLAFPERQVVAVVGDGGYTMLMGELATAVKYKLPIKILLIKNDSLGQIKWEQIAFLGNPEFGCDLQPIDFASVARGFGATGYGITEPSHCQEILAHALATPGPVLIEAVVDPNEPPLPPKITAKDAKNFATALARGTPEAGRILANALKDKFREMI